jgi:hypothetical protein
VIRSKPLSRKAPLRRSRMKRAGAPRRVTRPGPGRDEAYLEAVRKLPCFIASGDCEGDVVAHHAGPKSNDSTCVPLCWKHHGNWHDARGPFVALDKQGRRMWAESAIEVTRARTGSAGTQTQGESR